MSFNLVFYLCSPSLVTFGSFVCKGQIQILDTAQMMEKSRHDKLTRRRKTCWFLCPLLLVQSPQFWRKPESPCSFTRFWLFWWAGTGFASCRTAVSLIAFSGSPESKPTDWIKPDGPNPVVNSKTNRPYCDYIECLESRAVRLFEVLAIFSKIFFF